MVHDLICVIYAVTVVCVAGATVFYALVSQPSRYYRWERVVYSYPLGMTALALPMFLLSWAGVRMNVALISGLVAAAAVVTCLVKRMSLRQFWGAKQDTQKRRMPLSELEWVMVFVLVASLGAGSVACFLVPMTDWDSLCAWGLKAKVLWHDSIATSPQYFRGGEYRYLQQSYPLLWPLMYAWVCAVLGRWDDQVMMWINPLNVVLFVALLYGALRRIVDRPVALTVSAIAASMPALLHYMECGQADVPLMLIGGAAFFCFFDWLRRHHRDDLLLAAVLMGGALFTKHNAKFLYGAYLVGGMFAIWRGAAPAERKRLVGQLALFGGVAALMMVPHLVYLRSLPPEAYQFDGKTFGVIRWNQIPGLLGIYWDNMTSFSNTVGLPKWNLLWVILMLCLVTSKTPWQYPWNCLLLIYLINAAAESALFLASQTELRARTGGIEFGVERFTLFMLPPLWLVLGRWAGEQWRIWRTSDPR